MDKNEKLKLGDIFLAPKEFFLNNSVGKLKQQIESYAEVRKDGRVMCAVVEDVNSVFPPRIIIYNRCETKTICTSN
jgi:hypothetical protein